MGNDKTDFGFDSVSFKEKASRVRSVFSSVARRYDLMNDCMSFGIHRLWKNFAVNRLLLRPGYRVLDVAGGSGDLSLKMAPKVGPNGCVILSDINDDMLSVGCDRIIDAGLHKQVECLVADAQSLPFQNNYFDRVIIAFGLRNVTHKDLALREMYRVIKPGGKLVVLEFSKPVLPALAKGYDFYSMHIIPRMGKLLAGDEGSYRYLVESIRMHPGQARLRSMFDEAGFNQSHYHNLTGGIVAVHEGYKL